MVTTMFAVFFVLSVFARRPPGTHFTHSGAAPGQRNYESIIMRVISVV
jgi:hypothetical protein